ncbi:zinc-ribbon domain-containing protein [Flagellimonas allohymeniacidonis]|uniref:Zinc-ribbon domain-containing protein n=1 Tax=Flagellimonas allohymeniacidonis TaxID=2517819 RepID=A0A4Q8QF04_9FLAO|nr:zinc-ribbon domain-containing protein [Allomuricauda hymeniacidonis]
MILFFGTRPGKAKTQRMHNISCPHCHQLGTLSMVSQPNYFHLFWLPLFTINTSHFVECSHCKRVFYKEEFTQEMEKAIESL